MGRQLERIDRFWRASYHGNVMNTRVSAFCLGWQTEVIRLVLFIGLVGVLGCTAPWSKRDEDPVPTGRRVKDAISLYEMGRQLEMHGNYISAIDKYTESIQVSARPVAYYALGSLQAELRQFESAKENLRKAIDLSPGYVDARRELERVEAVEQLIERGEPIPETFRVKPVPPSLVEPPEETAEREPDALQGQATATPTPETPTAPLDSRPPPPPPSSEGAVPDSELPDLITQGIPPVAEKLSEDEEVQVRALLREGQILLDGGHVSEAIDLYQGALLEFPREGRIRGHLAYAHQRAGNYRAALVAYEDALRLGNASASLYNNLGVVYENLGRSHLAMKAYRKAIEMGDLPDAHYNLAVVLEKRGELEPALDEFEAYLALDSEGEFAERAQARADRLRRRVR